MVVTNDSSETFFLGSASYMLVPGGSVTVPDSVYNNDNAVARAINNLDVLNKASVTSAPSGYPRSLQTSVGAITESDVPSTIARDTETAAAVATHEADTTSVHGIADTAVLQKRIVQIKVFDDATALATGDMKASFVVPVELNGLNLIDADAFVTTVSSSGLPTVAIRRERSGSAVDMLSTSITIDVSEKTSYTASTPPVINASNDDVATGDLIYIDVDAAGTGTKGLGVVLVFG